MTALTQLARSCAPPLLAIVALVLAMGGSWTTSAVAAPAAIPSKTAAANDPEPPARVPKRPTGKLNLNTATEEQLMLLPSVGPAKAERIVTWRKKNGGFKRVADLRRVKGFGYKTFKRLEPLLDVKGDTTLAQK
jgi:competence protein ComEA